MATCHSAAALGLIRSVGAHAGPGHTCERALIRATADG